MCVCFGGAGDWPSRPNSSGIRAGSWLTCFQLALRAYTYVCCAASLLHTQGWIDTTYMNKEGTFRLSRGNKGTLFVCKCAGYYTGACLLSMCMLPHHVCSCCLLG